MVTKAQKQETIDRIKEYSTDASVAFVADFSQVSVAEISNLRRSLKKNSKCKGLVVKNTLADIALSKSEFADVSKFLTGPSFLVFGHDEAAGLIKDFMEFQKTVKPKLTIKGGVLAGDGKALEGKDIEAIGNLPPREVILAQIAGLLVSAPSSYVQSINQIISSLGELSVKVAEKK